MSTQVQVDKTVAAQGLRIATAAISAASIISKDDAAMQAMGAYSEARVLVKRGPLVFLVDHLRRVHGEALASWPVPGSENTDKTPTNNPDKFKRSAGNKTVSGSFYDEYADNTTRGREINDQLAGLLKRKDKMSGHLYDVDKKLLEAQRNAFRTLVKTAMRIEQQLWKLDEMPKIECHILTVGEGDEEQLMRVVSPFHLVDMTNVPKSHSNYRTLSIGELLALNVPAAIAAGGTLEALMESKGGAAEPEDDNDVPAIDGIEGVHKYTSELAAWLAGEKAKDHRALLIKKMGEKEKDGKTLTTDAKDLILSVGDILTEFGGVFEGKFDGAYARLVVERDATDKAEDAKDKAESEAA